MKGFGQIFDGENIGKEHIGKVKHGKSFIIKNIRKNCDQNEVEK